MYIAVNKADKTKVKEFVWTEADKLLIEGEEVSPSDWEIIEI